MWSSSNCHRNRYANKTVHDIFCTLFNTANVENELRFVCNCPLYTILRTNLYDEAILKKPNFCNFTADEKIVLLLTLFNFELYE